jgi:1-acyl-sn-glycerol-3-phosphate acyltransferase
VERRSGSTLKGVVTISLMALNVIGWCLVLFSVALLKFLVPIPAWRRWTSRAMTALAEGWIGTNNAIFRLVGALPLDPRGLEGLSTRDWYLVVSNHRSWVDILVLQAVFNRRVPFLKFFLKRQLIWVPFLGIAWWALDFPFMQRSGGSSGQADLERARRACEKFRVVPTSVINFLEGTRFTREKHDRQNSPYRHLLKPKVGGIATALTTLGAQFHRLLDVTIVYPDGPPTFWDILSGRVHAVTVRVNQREIPAELLDGDYLGDKVFRGKMQAWVTMLWTEKDALLAELKAPPAAAP